MDTSQAPLDPRPFIGRSFWEWALACEYEPLIRVRHAREGVRLPPATIREDDEFVTLSIHPSKARNVSLSYAGVEFKDFLNDSERYFVPFTAIVVIFAYGPKDEIFKIVMPGAWTADEQKRAEMGTFTKTIGNRPSYLQLVKSVAK